MSLWTPVRIPAGRQLSLNFHYAQSKLESRRTRHNVSTDRAYFVYIKRTVAMKEEGEMFRMIETQKLQHTEESAMQFLLLSVSDLHPAQILCENEWRFEEKSS